MALTFICQRCGHTLPVSYRHEEAPEYCFLDYVSEGDAALIAQIVDEVMSEPDEVRNEVRQ